MRRLRVQECDELACGSFEGNFVDELSAGVSSLLELALNVVGAEGDVVDAFTVLLKELGDGAVVGCRLQEFDMHFAHFEERGFYLLRCYFFATFAFQAEGLLVILRDLVEVLNRNAQMIDFLNHIFGRLSPIQA